jgi:hypothetical protein
MNDKRIGDMSRDELMDYIIELNEENGRNERKLAKLQSNWNSLREWIKENSWYYNTSDGCQWVDQFKLLDKMNELESGDNK